ncbi:hypothetical protein BVY04_02010 [bacterium M21]|nr:hypothetical protein BVY04_02010 [bacterium M21]
MKEILTRFRRRWLGFSIWTGLSLLTLAAGAVIWAPLLWVPCIIPMPPALETYALGLHFFLAFLFMTSFLTCLEDQTRAATWGIIAFFMSLILPGSGTILTIFCFLVVPKVEISPIEDVDMGMHYLIKKTKLAKQIEDLGSTGIADQNRVERLMMSWIDLTSVDDILQGDDLMKKRNAITALARQPSAVSVRKLRKLLGDDSPDICFCASSSLLKIEEKLTEESSKLRDLLLDDKEEPTLRTALAKNYLYSVELGILPQLTMDQRLKEVQELLADLPTAPERTSLSVRALQQLGNYKEVIKIVSQLDTDDPEMLFALCDAYLREAKINELRDICDRLTKIFWDTGDNKLYNVASWASSFEQQHGTT